MIFGRRSLQGDVAALEGGLGRHGRLIDHVLLPKLYADRIPPCSSKTRSSLFKALQLGAQRDSRVPALSLSFASNNVVYVFFVSSFVLWRCAVDASHHSQVRDL